MLHDGDFDLWMLHTENLHVALHEVVQRKVRREFSFFSDFAQLLTQPTFLDAKFRQIFVL